MLAHADLHSFRTLSAEPVPGLAAPVLSLSSGGGSRQFKADTSGTGSGSSSGGSGIPSPPPFPVRCPQGEVRLFIGIASRCCTEEVSGHCLNGCGTR